ncbi:nitroreductase family protein [Candidatus Micrarchaeota archaeon]|nr:nitroreductase family protein [Candidatus Micrarchaeota archaeon]
MEISELIKKSSFAQSFDNKTVEYSKIAKIVQGAISAPSSEQLQAYKIYVINSKEARENMFIACDYDQTVQDAPVLLLFCADLKRAEKHHGERTEFFTSTDAAVSATYAHIVARSEGLSANFISNFHPLEVLRIVNAGEYETAVVLMAIGYPKEEGVRKGQRAMKDIIREV